SYYGARKFDLASQYLEPVAKADPANAELHQVLAQSCLWARKFPCAEEEFRRIEEQNPDSAPAHVLTGEALDGVGKTSEAIAEFEAAAKISPSLPNVHFGLGYLHWKSEQYDLARQEFERELALDPNHALALAYIGDIEWKGNRPEAAISWLKRAEGVKKDLRIVYIDLAAIYVHQKDYKDAQTALVQAVALDPALPDAHYQLARLYYTLGRVADAEKESRKVRELHEKAAEDLVGKISSSPPALNPSEGPR
ncbi:MAG: tetratricopeptide repeat protein, partial [Terracidiphilus sp.]